MSELREMAAPLFEFPLVTPPRIEELRRRNRRRRGRHFLATGTGLAVVAMVAVLLVTELPPTQNQVQSLGSSTRLAAFIQQGVSVPDSALEAVGRPAQVRPLATVQGQSVLDEGGKPALVYVGAQWCAPCAFQRWAMLVALSRFGSFSNLGHFVIPSSAGLAMPESWSFVGSTYTSLFLSFHPADPSSLTASPDGQVVPAASLTQLQQQAFNALEGTDVDQQGIPFTDLANQFWVAGSQATMGPDNVLQGLSLETIAADLKDPSSQVAQLIDGAANYLIADICSLVGKQSAPICTFDTLTG